MPYNQTRAKAFAEYTITALVRDKSGKVLTISRADLARVLGVEKLWDKHIQEIAELAAPGNVGTANLGSRIAFVSIEDNPNIFELNSREACEITDKFEPLYGSRAADEMWEKRSYSSKKK